MKTKLKIETHTPGPWKVNAAGGITGSGEAIIINDLATLANYGGKPVNDGFGRAEANARLIALAPELVEALREICGNAKGDDKGRFCVSPDRIYTARALLAKL